MGWNTTVVVLNDALDQIAKDEQFGKKLARAIGEITMHRPHGVDVSAGNHANAATVIETHHADCTALVSVGGNMGVMQASTFGWCHHEPETQERLLRAWADRLGFAVVRKSAQGG